MVLQTTFGTDCEQLHSKKPADNGKEVGENATTITTVITVDTLAARFTVICPV